MSSYRLTQTGAEVQALLNKIVGIYRQTTAYWNAQTGYVPEAGDIIIYSDYKTVDGVDVPGIKVGSGNGYVQDLAFLGEADSQALLAHIADSGMHTSAAEKLSWNNKLNVNDEAEVVEEALVFNRN